MWTYVTRASLQGLYKVQETARHNNYYPNGLTHKWTKHYEQNLTHDQAVINDWNAMEDIESRLVEDSEDDEYVLLSISRLTDDTKTDL